MIQYGLQEMGAQTPEINVFFEIPLLEPRRPVPEWERRTIGNALRLEGR